MAQLSAAQRKRIPSKDFALPGRRYPISDRSHAANALARVSQFGTPAEKARVRAAVHRKYPTMGRLYARVGGGPVQPGQQYLVGEGGPEQFQPSATGHGSQAGYFDWGRWTPAGQQGVGDQVAQTMSAAKLPKNPTGPSMAPVADMGGPIGPVTDWGKWGTPAGGTVAQLPQNPTAPSVAPTAPGLGVKGPVAPIPDTGMNNTDGLPFEPQGQTGWPGAWDWYYSKQPMTPRARGGRVTAGRRYLVGERGPEVFVPAVAGRIIPNKALRRSVGSNYTRGK